ncbi:MAG: phosphatidylglycerophosphatase A [Acidobacteriota bacterium]
MKNLWRIIASFFGLGFFPVAPGTAASLAIVLLYRYFLFRWDWPYLLVLFLGLLFLGFISSSAYARELGQSDPRRVVIDEASGQLLVIFLVSPSWLLVLLAFFLFRFFDIVKPFPIRRVEKLPAGWGIMADDLVAGLMAKAILHAYLYLK